MYFYIFVVLINLLLYYNVILCGLYFRSRIYNAFEIKEINNGKIIDQIEYIFSNDVSSKKLCYKEASIILIFVLSFFKGVFVILLICFHSIFVLKGLTTYCTNKYEDLLLFHGNYFSKGSCLKNINNRLCKKISSKINFKKPNLNYNPEIVLIKEKYKMDFNFSKNDNNRDLIISDFIIPKNLVSTAIVEDKNNVVNSKINLLNDINVNNDNKLKYKNPIQIPNTILNYNSTNKSLLENITVPKLVDSKKDKIVSNRNKKICSAEKDIKIDNKLESNKIQPKVETLFIKDDINKRKQSVKFNPIRIRNNDLINNVEENLKIKSYSKKAVSKNTKLPRDSKIRSFTPKTAVKKKLKQLRNLISMI